MRLTRQSLFSRKLHTMELPITEHALDAYYQGTANIQDVFPHLTAAQREFIMSGITPEEWAEHLALAGETDEDEPSETDAKEPV